MSPDGDIEMAFRNAVLGLSVNAPFARRLVNAGRLSLPCHLGQSSLTGHDMNDFDAQMTLGAPCMDAPLTNKDGERVWLMNLLGNGFTLLVIGMALCDVPDNLDCIHIAVDGDYIDSDGVVSTRYGKGIYLIRPDQHVTARWLSDKVSTANISAALARAYAHTTS